MKQDNLSNKENFKNLISIQASISQGARNHYDKIGLQYVEVPAIVGITGACENVDTLFKVGNRLNLPLFFTQTGQLALEQALELFHGVYTTIHSGRDEEIEDARHLRQFRLTEEEFDCTLAGMTPKTYDDDKMYEALLAHIEKATKSMISSVVSNNKEVISRFYKRDIRSLKKILSRPYLRVRYEEAIELLRIEGYDVSFGEDLKSDHEAKIVEILNRKTQGYGTTLDTFSPVFIMKYPKEIKFFNMKVSQKDERVVLSADCIFPYSGEAVGAAVREHDGIKLIIRLLTSTMYKLHEQRGGKYDDFKWYTENMILAQKTLPHAGYGIGNERIIQFILGSNDIRSCSVFSLMTKETGDWDEARRGMSPMLGHRKTVLLSIGRSENKEKLLPYLKQIKSDGHIFYSTKNTHEFLLKNGVPTTLVFKISEDGKPNLKELLNKNMFDLIINIPTDVNRNEKEFSDGKFIRESALDTGTPIFTDPNLAKSLLEKISRRKNLNGNGS